MATSLKQQLQDDMRNAMRSKEKERLSAIRFVLAAVKQKEIDEKIILNDSQILAILDKLIKQRLEAIKQYQTANREDLVKKEQFELSILQVYMPKPLTEQEIDQMVQQAIDETNASSIQEMSKVMNLIKPKAQGRADMSSISVKVKKYLTERNA